MAGVGLLISVSSRSAVQAQGAAVFAWFGFVLLYDLVLIGALSVSGMRAEWLAAALVANPVDAARVLGVLALEPDLYLLGPGRRVPRRALLPAGRRRAAARRRSPPGPWLPAADRRDEVRAAAPAPRGAGHDRSTDSFYRRGGSVLMI